MSARLLKGKDVAAALDESSQAAVADLAARGIVPTLGLLRVGERPDDVAYERNVIKRAEKVGVQTKSIVLPADVSQEALIAQVEALNEDDAIHGVLMFRPLPKGIDEDAVCNTLLPSKDADAITGASLTSIFTGKGEGFAPCTAQACVEICDHYGIELEGKRVVVVGRSLVIGKPVSMLMLNRNATVTIAHSRTRDLAQLTKEADIVVACVGKAQMLDAEYFAPGQTVIDVGINFIDGHMVGDVNTEQAAEIVDAITPVPGGVGAVTTSVMVNHVVRAAQRA